MDLPMTTDAGTDERYRVDRRTLLRSGFATGAAALAGCGGSQASESAPENETAVTDATGRSVTVPTPVERIVALGPGTLRQVAYLDATDRVVGVERGEQTSLTSLPYSVANPRFQELPVVGPSGPNATGNVEAILEVDPDLILLSAVSGGEAAERVASQTGVPTVVLPMPFPTAERAHQVFYEMWRQLGTILGADERVENLIRAVETHVDRIRTRVPEEASPSVYAGGVSFKGAQGLAATWVPYPPFVYAGADNVAAGVETNGVAVTINRERLLSWDPEYVFVSAQNAALVRDDLDRHPALASLDAFQDGAAYSILPVAHYHVNVGSMLVNAYYVGQRIYGDGFGDLDLPTVADEVFADLLGEDIYEELVTPLEVYEQFAPPNG